MLMTEKILMVDDETAILQGYQRLLHGSFHTTIAMGAAAALVEMNKSGPFAVVVADMRMPDMDGAQLLAQIKNDYPETVRVMLTGNADMQTAVRAVNDGNIFRFLTKPCTKNTLAMTLTASLVQYRLVTAEKELLENTLRGTISVLTDVLSLVNPEAFSRAARIRRYIRHIAYTLKLSNPWRFEIAGMLSQLGCVALDAHTIEAGYAGKKPLSPEDQARFDAHPSIAADLLGKIPRLEPIAWMIAHQNQDVPVEGDIADPERADMRLGASILRATLAFDELVRRDVSKTEAAHQLSRQHRNLDPRIFQALVELRSDLEEYSIRRCRFEDLTPGMLINEDIHSASGTLLVTKGQEVTMPLILKLKNFSKNGGAGDSIEVCQPLDSAVAAGR
jgi:response regulator RpfG family c-di-GMP phosphodiesterase